MEGDLPGDKHVARNHNFWKSPTSVGFFRFCPALRSRGVVSDMIQGMESIAVLLDTDPGNDIDDALAISYLLSEPLCDLVGITTVTGETMKRSAIAEVLVRAAGKTVPIHSGQERALGHGPGQPGCAQYDAIADLPHERERPRHTAVDFMRRTIRERPGEIVLLSIGMFGNIGLLFHLDPEIPGLLRGFFSMAGSFWRDSHHEHNCICDPTALSMVLAAPRIQHRWSGLDVTMQCHQPPNDVRSQFRGPLLGDLCLPMAENWFQHADRITFHDPLAAVSIFHPNVCTFKSGTVTSDPVSGETFFAEGPGSDLVAHSVQADRFFEIFYETVLRP